MTATAGKPTRKNVGGSALQRGSRAAVLALGVILASGCGANSDLPHNEATADGMTIDIGVIPAELVRGHPVQPSDQGALHGGVRDAAATNHLVVALFDAKTGARITDARIQAGVGDRSYNHEPDRWLEPMQINGAMSYGNFFLMPGPGEWRIHLAIYRPGVLKPFVADFAYDKPSDS